VSLLKTTGKALLGQLLLEVGTALIGRAVDAIRKKTSQTDGVDAQSEPISRSNTGCPVT
jgi:hypothetical protein